MDTDGTGSGADLDTNLNDDTTDITNGGDAVANVTDSVSNNSTDTIAKPFYQTLECEPLDDSWMCSSGSKNHSLCIKFCSIG